MDCKRTDAAVLQLLGERGDDFVFAVPPQTGLDRHRQLHRIDHRTRDLQQLGHVAEHSCPRAFRRHLLHRTSEIDVDDVRTGCLGDFCSLHHRFHLLAVDLYRHRPLGGVGVEFAGGAVDVAHKSVGRHEFRVDHIGSLLFADETERRISHVFHRCQQHRALSQVNCSYLHSLLSFCVRKLRIFICLSNIAGN